MNHPTTNHQRLAQYAERRRLYSQHFLTTGQRLLFPLPIYRIH